MKKVFFALYFLLLASPVLAHELTISESVKYRLAALTELSKQKVTGDFSIQEVELISAGGLSKQSIKNINLELKKSISKHKILAEQCRKFSQGGPWQYESQLEKIMLTKNYLSVVFSRQTVCGGSPGFERDPLVFSTKNGKFIPTGMLMAETFPGHTIPENIQSDKQLTPLDEDLADTLINDSKKAQTDFNEKCEFYLRGSTYRIWMEDKRMMFFPEYLRPEAHCQSEYFINLQ